MPHCQLKAAWQPRRKGEGWRGGRGREAGNLGKRLEIKVIACTSTVVARRLCHPSSAADKYRYRKKRSHKF